MRKYLCIIIFLSLILLHLGFTLSGRIETDDSAAPEGLRIRAVTAVQGLEYFVNLDEGMSFRLDSFYPITEVFVEDEKRIYARRLGHWYKDSEIQIKF